MSLNRFLVSTLTSLLLCVTLSGATPAQTLLKKHVLADLDWIENIFEVKYAPKFWKMQFAKWDLTEAIVDAKNRIENVRTPNLKEYQVILRDFFNSTHDHHVGVRFFSTESASLPFFIKGAEGRYFISYVDRDYLPVSLFPFNEGDEILSFGGTPVSQAVEELHLREYGSNNSPSNRALAEISLTQRRGDLGHWIPSGSVEISGIQKGSSQKINSTLTWSYTPEKIKDFSKFGLNRTVQCNVQAEGNFQRTFNLSQFLGKSMTSFIWDKSYVGASNGLNKHALGARSSFIPSLGIKQWSHSQDGSFDAYIFMTPSGKRIGYIRIPHYNGDEEELIEFGEIINFFQLLTNGMVIDQVNNPGGSLFYLYALASTLTDKPLHTPKHRVAMTQEEVYEAHHMLLRLKEVTDDRSARKVIGESVGGYPVDYKFSKVLEQFCNFMIAQWDGERLLSDPTFLFGFDGLQPHPKYRYTKPILVLVNSLDFSGGDFFPAILQDNKRATIFGEGTAGAGGFVFSLSYPNHSGVRSIALTASLALRTDQQTLENLGVIPDIKYDLSVTDLQENYKDYVAEVLKALELLVKH